MANRVIAVDYTRFIFATNFSGNPVKYPPKVYLVSGDNEPVLLSEEAVGCIDQMRVKNVNVILNPYEYDPINHGMSLYVRMINPKPYDIEELMKNRLIGFNCRRYDNHILYARLMGYSNAQLYSLSQRIISGGKRADCFFGESYTSAGNKKSLKKFEIELGIQHQELGLPWDEPVPEEM